MNTITMLKTKWYLVEMFTAKKQFRITVRKPLDTKVQAVEFENSRVKAHNYKSLCKLIQDGWTDLNSEADTTINPTQENAVEVKETASNVIDLTGDAEVEAQIEAYAKAKIERDIKAYEEKKRKQMEIERFLATPPKQVSQKPFDYSKQLDKFYTKQAPRNQRDKQRQIADYCGEVNL